MHKKQDKRAYPFKKKHFQSQHCFETRTFVGGTGKENQHKKEKKNHSTEFYLCINTE